MAENERRENRLRTTLAHEFGHAKFHAALFDASSRSIDLFAATKKNEVVVCKRDGILNAPKIDWMEWQAGHVSGAILMPLSAVCRYLTNIQEKFGIFGPASDGSIVAGEMISAVMDKFQVSAEAARVRLIRLGLIGKHPSSNSLF